MVPQTRQVAGTAAFRRGAGPLPRAEELATESGRSPSRKREGFRLARPPGVRAVDQDRNRCSRARVIPTYSSRRSSSTASGVSAKEIGMSPSLSPTRNTASHSRPLAACSEARVTPWTVGACWARERSWSSLTKSERLNCGAAADHEFVGQRDERREGFPAFPEGAAAVRGGVRVAQRGDDVADQLAQRLGAGGFGDGPGGGPQLQDGVADFLAGKEPLPAAQLVADPRRGQRLFVGFGLAVGAEQHGDLAGRGAGVEQLADLDRHGGGLGLVVGAFGELRHRAGRALRHELQRRGPGGVRDRAAAAPAGQQLVGQPHHLRRGAVVADQLDHVGVGVHGP